MAEERPRVNVGAVVFNNEGEILLLKSPKWAGKYILPCGHVEFGEKLEEALKREVKEETGLDVKEVIFIKFIEFIRSEEFRNKNLHFIGFQFKCKTEKTIVELNDEADDFLWERPTISLNLDLEIGTRETIEFYLNNLGSRNF